MTETIIASPTNLFVKRIRSLQQRKHREREGVFFVEGIRPVWQAISSHAQIETLVIAPDLLTSEPARGLLEGQRAAGMPMRRVTAEVFESIADREHPSGVAAIVRAWAHAPDTLSVRRSSFFVALHDAGNPGNLGTILRTLDAVGGSGLILVGHGTDPFHPTAVKASMGTLFTVPLVRSETPVQLVKWARDHEVQIVTTSASAPTLYWSASYRLPALFVFGSEGQGLPDTEWAGSDLSVRIPMAGAADSLNLAVSVGVLLYEVKRELELAG